MSVQKVRDLQREFLSAAAELAQKLTTSANRISVKDVASVLERTICDCEALWLLTSRHRGAENIVDGYWTSKHEYAKRKVVEELVNRLYALHLPAEIVLEGEGPNATGHPSHSRNPGQV